MIRLILAALTALYLAAAGVTFVLHLPLLLTGYLAINGALILAGLIIERGRYRAKAQDGPWEATGERFVDPASGHLVEVRYNRRSGKRQYVDLGPAERR